MLQISCKTTRRDEFYNITEQVREAVLRSGVQNGFCTVFVPHTTAGITINENADPDVKRDLLHKLRNLIPPQEDYLHSEGNSDAHLKASLMGSSAQIIVADGKLALGVWQGIYLAEFDGPRERQVYVSVTGSAEN